VKPKNMLTWMLWSAAAALSPPSHGQVLNDATGITSSNFRSGDAHYAIPVRATGSTPTPKAPEIDPAGAASGLTLFLGGLALARATWAARQRRG
jgi:hypothetical protein